MKASKNRKVELSELLSSYAKMAQGDLGISTKAKTLGVTAAAVATGGAALDAAVVTVSSGVSFNSGDSVFEIDMNADSVIDFAILDGILYSSTFLFGSAAAAGSLNDSNRVFGFRNSAGTATYANRINASTSINALDGDVFDNYLGSNNAFRNRRAYLQYIGGSAPNSQFVNGERGFVGVQFDISGSSHLGFIDIEGTATGLIIHGWAYNDVNVTQTGGDSILTAQIPEVSQVGGIALLAAGAVGIAEMRRRRIKRPAAKQ